MTVATAIGPDGYPVRVCEKIGRHPCLRRDAARWVCARWEKDTGGKPGRCQWLDGEPSERRYCGRRTITPTSSFCAGHALKAFIGFPRVEAQEAWPAARKA